MSCGDGNRFSCGLKRFQAHKFTPDRPANQELHNENQKRLNDLLRLREEQDKGIFKEVTQNPELEKFYQPWSPTEDLSKKK